MLSLVAVLDPVAAVGQNRRCCPAAALTPDVFSSGVRLRVGCPLPNGLVD